MAAALLILGAGTAQARQGELIERTVAIVGAAVITQSDVRLAQALGLVDAPPDDAGATTARLIERWLVLHEVARFAPPEPDSAAIDAVMTAIRARAGSPPTLAAVLARAGYSENRLRSWARDDLRIAAYLDQRFAAAGAPTDADIAGYMRAHAAELDALGLNAAETAGTARARLLTDRRRDLVTDWLADLRRRSPVIVIDAR